MGKCSRCDGTGVVWKYSDYGCPHCNPKKLVTCSHCDGTGIVLPETAPDAHLEAAYEDRYYGGVDLEDVAFEDSVSSDTFDTEE